jgi:hypothetical protein
MGNLKFRSNAVNLNWINGDDDKMVKVMNCEEYQEWREPKFGFLSKMDKVQFLSGLSVFIIWAGIIITCGFKFGEWLFLPIVLCAVGAIAALTSKMCMKV